MKWPILLIIFSTILWSCSGQGPAQIKNSTKSKNAVSANCQNLNLSDKVLNKKNLINILSCSGWDKKFPALTNQLVHIDENVLNEVLTPVNDEFFKDKKSRKKIFTFFEQKSTSGQMRNLSLLLEKSLKEYKSLSVVSHLLEKSLSETNGREIFKFISSNTSDNQDNLKTVAEIARLYEGHKEEINRILSIESSDQFQKRMIVLFNDIANLQKREWGYFSELLKGQSSSLKKWSQISMESDVEPLLRILQNSDFVNDVRNVRNIIGHGLKCRNNANEKDFILDVGYELKHKIESLKYDSIDDFEKTMLHGMTKYVAFREFCKDSTELISFSHVLQSIFKIIPSEHDMTFLKELHLIFGEDRFAILRFLSSSNFSEWASLLSGLRPTGDDISFVNILHSIISSTSVKDLSQVSIWLKELERDDSQFLLWFKAGIQLWKDAPQEEKREIIRLVSVLADKDINVSEVAKLFHDLVIEFPNVSEVMHRTLSDFKYQDKLVTVLGSFSGSEIENELGEFLSQEGLFEFIKIITQTQNSTYAPTGSTTPSLSPYIVRQNSSHRVSQTNTCYEAIAKSDEDNYSYYMLVKDLPEVCLNVLGDVGFVGRVFLWMNASNRFFEETYAVNDFHSAAGIWSPAMLHFIYTAAIQADSILVSTHSRGILNNLEAIHKTMTSHEMLETVHLGSLVLSNIARGSPVDTRLQSFLSRFSNSELNNLSKAFISFTSNYHEDIYSLKFTNTSCSSLDGRLGVNPCLSKKEISEKVIDILRVLKRKNDKDTSLLQGILGWLHPKGHIKDHTSISEIIRFASDLSNQKTTRNFIMHDAYKSYEVQGTIIDRLEVVIRDISFNNNFYGAYFKNEVTKFSSYRDEMLKSKKMLNWLDRLGGLMRQTGPLSKDSKWRVKNVRNAFSSMVEVSDNFVQPDGTLRTYNNFIQSLLRVIKISSKESTQNFNAYRMPNDEMVEGHNGIFLTKLVELSTLRQLGRYVHSRFGAMEALNTKEFISVENNLLGRHKLSLLQKGAQDFLDNYLDGSEGQLNIFIEDIVAFISSLNHEEQQVLESILLKATLLLSDSNINEERIYQAFKVFEFSIKNWEIIRNVLISVNEKSLLLKSVNQFMVKVINDKSEKSIITTLLDSQLLTAKEIEDLLNDKEFIQNLVNFVKFSFNNEIGGNDLNWQETMTTILGGPTLKWGPIREWLSHSVASENKSLTFSLLVEVLGEKKQSNYRLKLIMDELFINHRAELTRFLSDTFPGLRLISD